MSFKKFSESQPAPSNDNPVNKAKALPVDGEPAAQPAKKQDKAALEKEGSFV